MGNWAEPVQDLLGEIFADFSGYPEEVRGLFREAMVGAGDDETLLRQVRGALARLAAECDRAIERIDDALPEVEE